jgi:hypothetical protein
MSLVRLDKWFGEVKITPVKTTFDQQQRTTLSLPKPWEPKNQPRKPQLGRSLPWGIFAVGCASERWSAAPQLTSKHACSAKGRLDRRQLGSSSALYSRSDGRDFWGLAGPGPGAWVRIGFTSPSPFLIFFLSPARRVRKDIDWTVLKTWCQRNPGCDALSHPCNKTKASEVRKNTLCTG